MQWHNYCTGAWVTYSEHDSLAQAELLDYQTCFSLEAMLSFQVASTYCIVKIYVQGTEEVASQTQSAELLAGGDGSH